MNRIIFIVAFWGMISYVAGQTPKRPDQLPNLVVWIKADSLQFASDTPFTDGGEIDTVFNWGSLGGNLRNATPGQKPIFRANASPSGLPAMDFDGVNDNLTSSLAASSFTFLSNGAPNTAVVVFKLNSLSRTHTFVQTNNSNPVNAGVAYRVNSSNKFNHEINNDIANVSTTSASAGTIYIMSAVLQTTATPDTSLIRINGVNESTYQHINAPYNISAPANSLMIGIATTSCISGFIYEIVIYSDQKSETELADLELYLDQKWNTYNFIEGNPGLAQLEDHLDEKWNTYDFIDGNPGLVQLECHLSDKWTGSMSCILPISSSILWRRRVIR